jgi:hypothetical protein
MIKQYKYGNERLMKGKVKPLISGACENFYTRPEFTKSEQGSEGSGYQSFADYGLQMKLWNR